MGSAANALFEMFDLCSSDESSSDPKSGTGTTPTDTDGSSWLYGTDTSDSEDQAGPACPFKPDDEYYTPDSPIILEIIRRVRIILKTLYTIASVKL